MVANLLIFLGIAVGYLACFKTEDGWSLKAGIDSLRFFTLISNLFCAFAALAMAIAFGKGTIPYWVWLCKFIGTAAVTVTLFTVLAFIGPMMGYESQLFGNGLILHLVAPLLSIASFCFSERFYPLTVERSMLGVLPVFLYGLFYMYKVIFCKTEKRWEDFYCYNKHGLWPLSFAAMMLGSAACCLLLRVLYRL